MRKKYNTPHRSRVVKTRLSEDEYADFTARLAPYGISQSEFLRQAIRRATIRPVIHVSAVNDELLSAVGKLAAEYGRIGGNLNQIARYQAAHPESVAGRDRAACFRERRALQRLPGTEAALCRVADGQAEYRPDPAPGRTPPQKGAEP